MKAVILAGGRGTRILEETSVTPKPMIEIGGRPIIWHIMKYYAHFGIDDFIICLGYKGYIIKEFFANYFLHTSDVTINLKNNQWDIHQNSSEPWRVTLVDTGMDTMTGGRLKRVRDYIGDEDFCFTYGDGLANVDIHQLIKSHRQSGQLATVTAVRPPGRYGALILEDAQEDSTPVLAFEEKPKGDGGWINGGFFVLSPQVINLIAEDSTHWELEPLETLASEGQLNAYLHHGFWQPMDTLRDLHQLEKLWDLNKAPWKVWDGVFA